MHDIILFSVAVLGFVFSCGSGAIWYLEYYAKRETKKYAAELEFKKISDSLNRQNSNLENHHQDIQRQLDILHDDNEDIKQSLSKLI